MPYKNRQAFLEYQRWYAQNVRKKQVPWYKKSPENYAKYLLHQKHYRQNHKFDKGAYYYKRKRQEFVKSIGKCQICGYSTFEALVLHHPKPFNNRYLHRGSATGITKAIRENNAVILCANCHMLVHANIIPCPQPVIQQATFPIS